jgi:GT2 family glycosyltransferase
LEKDNGQYNDDCELFWASGACFFVRSTVFKALKGFDEDFFAHQEEIDLCWRIFNSNYKIKYNSKSVVYHVGGATLDKVNPKKTKLNFRNSLLMLTKNLPQSKLFSVILVRLILDELAGMHFLFNGKPKHTWAILEAHFEFYTLFRLHYKKRGEYQTQKYYKTKSIVYLYFVKKIKIFSSIFDHTK